MNSKQYIHTTMAAILLAISYNVYAEGDKESPQVNNGYPDYWIKPSYDFTEGWGKYHSQNTRTQSTQGDNGNNGNKAKRSSDKSRFNGESAWYKPWTWYDNPDKVDDKRQNSNRQSDPDSTHGQARAEERRDDYDHSKIDLPWYDPRGWFER